MSQGETRLQRRIQDALMAEGYFCWKNHGNGVMMVGLPDIIACVEGHLVGLEVKLPSKRDNTSVAQDYVMGRIRRAGGVATVVTSVAEALRVCEQAKFCRAPDGPGDD